MKNLIFCAAMALGSAAFVGCASQHEEGVKSDYRSQWTMVNADTMTTTDAAKAVLGDHALKNVAGTATKDDGKAMGKKADGTDVNVAIKKDGTGSEVSVTVGMMGDPAMGAQLAKEIKMKAEGMPGAMTTPMTTPKTGM